MSTQINQYIMYGVKWSKEQLKVWEKQTGKDLYDDYEEYWKDNAFTTAIGGKDGIFILTGPMNGKYIVIGEVLQKTRDGEYLDDMEIPQKSEADNAVLCAKINKLLDTDESQVTECKMYVITNYR